MRLILGLLLTLVCSASFAANSWEGPFTIKKVSAFMEDGMHIVSVTTNDVINSSCTIADKKKVAGYWSTALSFQHTQGLSVLLSAQAQNKPVMLYVDLKRCENKFATPFYGVEVASE
ncbi:hypothetical protein [Endozoicomonas sp. Mp262]|uniref:hypothetical protein n=1 Tax=Endozoicomonas sp. Mp262 TaxID=2919499 RepID=UPI0021DB4820